MWIGDKGYDFLFFLNREFNCLCVWCKWEYWLFVGYIKKYIKGVNEVIVCYWEVCCRCVDEMGFDGVVCGYIYYFESSFENGIYYINDGDWIENCSVLLEDVNGNLFFIYYFDLLELVIVILIIIKIFCLEVV